MVTSPQSATRGTKTGGGKLTQQLERQAKDGGRAEEARREAERKGNEPLVVSALCGRVLWLWLTSNAATVGLRRATSLWHELYIGIVQYLPYTSPSPRCRRLAQLDLLSR